MFFEKHDNRLQVVGAGAIVVLLSFEAFLGFLCQHGPQRMGFKPIQTDSLTGFKKSSSAPSSKPVETFIIRISPSYLRMNGAEMEDPKAQGNEGR